MSWEVSKVAGTNPFPRNYHSSALFNGKVYVFGGINEKKLFNSLHILNTAGLRAWNQNPVTGTLPAPRYSHTATIVDKEMIVFGGKSVDEEVINELVILAAEKLAWTRPRTIGEPPSPRQAHSATLVRDSIFYHGGECNGKLLGESYLFQVKTRLWSPVKVSGTIPPPLSHHTVEIIGDNLYLFGGNDAMGFSNTLYVLNTKTWAWTTPATLGTVPAPRSGHSACALAKSILIFGGAGANGLFSDTYNLDVETLTWQLVPNVDAEPVKARAGHTTTVVAHKHVYLMGGYGDGKATDIRVFDTIKLDSVPSLSSSRSSPALHVPPSAQQPLPRATSERVVPETSTKPSTPLHEPVKETPKPLVPGQAKVVVSPLHVAEPTKMVVHEPAKETPPKPQVQEQAKVAPQPVPRPLPKEEPKATSAPDGSSAIVATLQEELKKVEAKLAAQQTAHVNELKERDAKIAAAQTTHANELRERDSKQAAAQTTHANELKERDAKIAAAQTTHVNELKERDAKMAALQSVQSNSKDADAKLVALQTTHANELKDRDAKLAALQSQVKDLDAKIAALQTTHANELKDRDAKLTALQSTQSKDSDARIVALQTTHANELKERDAKLTALQSMQSKDSDTKLASMQSTHANELRERDAKIAALQSTHASQISDRDARMTAIQSTHANELREKAIQIVALESTKDADSKLVIMQSAHANEINERKTKLEGLERTLSERDEKIRILEEHAQKVDAQIVEHLATLHDRNEQLSAQGTMLATLQAQHAAASITSKKDAQIDALDDELRELKAQLERRKTEEGKAQATIAEQQARIKELSDAQAAQGNGDELASLRTALAGRNSELQSYLTKTEKDAEELRTARAELTVFREGVERESVRIKQEKDLAPFRDNDLVQLRSALEKKDSEVVLLRQKSETDMRALQEQVVKQSQNLQTTLVQREEELAQARATAEKEKDELNAELQRLKEQFNPDEIQALRSALSRSLERERELSAREREREAAQKDKEGKEDKDEKDTEIVELKKKLQDMEHQLKHSDKNLTQSMELYAKSSSEVPFLKDEVEAKEVEITRLKAALAEAEAKANSGSANGKAAEDNLTSQLDGKDKELAQLRATLEDKIREMELAESELESRFLTIEALEARIGELDSRPPTSGEHSGDASTDDLHNTINSQTLEIQRLQNDVQQWMDNSEQLENLGQEAMKEIHTQYDTMVQTAKEWQQKYEEQVHLREVREAELNSSEQKLGQLDTMFKRLMNVSNRKSGIVPPEAQIS